MKQALFFTDKTLSKYRNDLQKSFDSEEITTKDFNKGLQDIENLAEGEINGKSVYVLIKGEDDEELEKAEGSRGGRVIGHTKSGKPIYDHFNHESHKKFNKQDHADAATKHYELKDKHYDNCNEFEDNEDEDNAEKELNEGHYHLDEGNKHNNKAIELKKSQSSTEQLEEKHGEGGSGSCLYTKGASNIKKSLESVDNENYLEKGEGSRGGKVIGHKIWKTYI